MIKKIIITIGLIVIYFFLNYNNGILIEKVTNRLYDFYYMGKFFYYDIRHVNNKNVILNNKEIKIDENIKIHRLITHGADSIDGNVYTNSLEALNANYSKGFRMFELDIRKTKDNKYVAVHEWEEWARKTKYKGELPPLYKDFKISKIYQKYTPLDINDINNWLSIHKDAILVTDKVNTPGDFLKFFKYKDRLIMELFSWRAVNKGLINGIKVMPNWNLISNMGNNVVSKLSDLNISFVAADNNIIKENKDLLKMMMINNIKVYSYGTYKNKSEIKDEKYVICNESEYFYGVYADNWDFSINCNRNKNVTK